MATQPRWLRFDRQELVWLLVGPGPCVLLLAFLVLAGDGMEGATQAFATRLLPPPRGSPDPTTPKDCAIVDEDGKPVGADPAEVGPR